MKKTTFAFMLMISVPVLFINAQDRHERDPERREKFNSMKIAYFTEELELTSAEAEKFWPVYNEYEKKKSAQHWERRRSFRNFASETETISDEQAEKMIEQYMESHKKGLQQEIEFYSKIKEVLPPKKIMKLYITELQFREHILKQLRGEKQDQGGNRH